jgi:hypothetical protein
MTSAPLAFRGRVWRWTKRLTASALVLVMAAVPLAAFGLPKLVAHAKAHAKVEKALTRALGTPVQLGAMSFSWKDGLLLQDVSTKDDSQGCSFRIDSVTLKPRWSKLLRGTVRLNAELRRPEVVVADTGNEIRTLRLPKFGKKGLGLEHVKITDGTYVLQSGTDDRTLRIDGISTEGTGALRNRSVRMELQSLTGSFRGTAVTGRGLLRLSQNGFRGELDVNENAAKEPELRDALRAAGVTLRKAPEMSELF